MSFFSLYYKSNKLLAYLQIFINKNKVMSKKFRLNYYLNSIVNDILNERYESIPEQALREKIFNYLDFLYEHKGFKVYSSINLINEKFKKELISEAVCEMSDDEDYLSPTINKKITQISKEYLKEWINDKITL